MAFRIFMARRGRPRTVYSDKGTNFRGANNELSELDWEKITREANLRRILWKFNPPTASWWGVFWQRLVRVLKELLRRSLGKSILSFEELETVLCDCVSLL
ncbi:integrase catalytic domain-containing protein [Trichonephila clavipes]|nr:integrase catalytic domain-containing protein [Trichonephila clavipes]